MSEVYDVCKRLKEAGFPQDGSYWVDPDGRVWYGDATESDLFKLCPNASECMKFAREKWPLQDFMVGYVAETGDEAAHFWASRMWDSPDIYLTHRTHPTDPDQAARLALAAALEAQQ